MHRNNKNDRFHWARCGAAKLAGLTLMFTVGCAGANASSGSRDFVYPDEIQPAATDVFHVAFTHELSKSDRHPMRAEEFSTVGVDPVDPGKIYAGGRDGVLFALDSSKGNVIWETDLSGPVSSEPVRLAEGPLIVGTAKGTVFALDPDTAEVLWSYQTPGRILGAPVAVDGTLYVANSRDQVFALSVESGEWRWQYERELKRGFSVFGRAGLTFVSDVVIDGKEHNVLYTAFSDGRVVALGADTGDALWETNLAPAGESEFVDVDTTPVFDPSEGTIVVGGQAGGVYGLDPVSGQKLWGVPIEGVTSLSAVAPGVYLCGSSTAGVYILDSSGTVQWRSPSNPGVIGSTLSVDGMAFATHSESGLMGYSQSTGELLTQVNLGSGVSGRATYDPRTRQMYIVSNNGLLIALGMSHGTERRTP